MAMAIRLWQWTNASLPILVTLYTIPWWKNEAGIRTSPWRSLSIHFSTVASCSSVSSEYSVPSISFSNIILLFIIANDKGTFCPSKKQAEGGKVSQEFHTDFPNFPKKFHILHKHFHTRGNYFVGCPSGATFALVIVE